MENKTSFNKTLHFVATLLRCLGINVIHDKLIFADRIKYRALYFAHVLIASGNLTTCSIWVIYGVMTGEDFADITFIIPCLIINVLAQLKGLFLVINEKTAQTLIADLINLEENHKKRKQSAEKDDIVKTEEKFLNLVIKILNIFYMILLLSFSLTPLLVILVNFLMTKKLDLIIPFYASFGFDPCQKMVWPFVYIYQCWSEVVVLLTLSSADYFFFVCCTYIRIQCRLLIHDIENIIPKNWDINAKFMEDEEFNNNFIDLVKWHQELIEAANKLEIIYSKSTLFNFCSSSMIICLTGFNVSVFHDAVNVIGFLSFLVMSLMQIFALCFFADLLSASSVGISEAAYNSRWYMAEMKIGRKLLIILTRAQKPCKITAFGFADVNLNSFMRVLSTSYSYFALLQTMYTN